MKGHYYYYLLFWIRVPTVVLPFADFSQKFSLPSFYFLQQQHSFPSIGWRRRKIFGASRHSTRCRCTHLIFPGQFLGHVINNSMLLHGSSVPSAGRKKTSRRVEPKLLHHKECIDSRFPTKVRSIQIGEPGWHDLYPFATAG